MSPGAIEAGRAFVRLMTDNKPLEKGLKKAQAKVKMFAATTGDMGRKLLGMSAAMAAPLVAGTRVFAQFEQQMSNVATMLDEPEAHMTRFQEGIKRMQIEFGESSEALAGGLYDILSASVPAANALDVLETSVRAAKAGLTDTKTAADAITTVLNSYGMAATEAGEVSDLLFTVVRRGKTTFAELAPNIGKVTSVASTAGVSLEELGAMLATLTRNGIQTEDAITAVQNVIQTFLKPSDEAKQIAKDLGFEMSTATIQAEGLAGVFERISNLPPEAVSKLFPNIRAIRGIVPALNNMEALTDDIEAMQDAAGATGDAFGQMSDDVQHKLNQLWESIKVAAAEIGAALRDSLVGGAEDITRISEAAAEWIKQNQGLVQTLGKVAVVAGAVGGALLALSVAGSGAATAMGVLNGTAKGLVATLHFLQAHPVIASLTAVGAVVGSLALYFDQASSAVEYMASTMGDVRRQADEMRVADMKLWGELQMLAEKSELSNEEFERAESILARLESRYGDLGLEIDKTSGVMGDMTQAQKDLSESMKQATLAQLRAEARGMANEIDRMQAAQAPTPTTGLGELYAGVKGIFSPGELFKSDEQRLEEARRELEAIQQKRAELDALQQRIDALKGGEEDALTGGAGGPKPGVDPAEAAAEAATNALEEIQQKKRAADFEAEMDRRAHDARLAMIEDEEKRELAKIRRTHQEEIEKAEEAGQDLARLEEVQAAEIAAIQQDHRRRRMEEERRKEEQQKRREENLAEEIAELEIRAQYEGVDKQLRLIEQRRKRAIEQARALGDPLAPVNRKFDLLSQLAQKDPAQAGARVTTAGTFSAAQAMRMGGGRSVEKQQLDKLTALVEEEKATRRVLEAGMSLV